MTSLETVALLVPTRGRPEKFARLYESCLDTCTTNWFLIAGMDDDDHTRCQYVFAKYQDRQRLTYRTGDRTGLGGWTNRLAWDVLANYPKTRYLVSIGDDMVPVTPGWDQMLIDAMPPGGGFTYPQDKRRDDIPEIVMTTTAIVRALGYLAEPSLRHWYIDNVWRDLGSLTGSLRFVPEAVVEHRHPNVPGGDQPDGTYYQAAESYDSDLCAYQRWRLKRMRADADAVRGVRAEALDSV